eukprot:jgi/Chrzof1/8344/Cz03g06270.t1
MDATFAESLYGLKRQSTQQQPQPPGSSSSSSSGLPTRLTQQQYRLALFCEVCLPYIQAKCDKLYNKHVPRTVLGLAVARATSASSGSSQRPAGQAPWQQFLWRCQKHALQGFVHVYPYAHSAIEAAKFGCQLMYLLDASAWHSPVLYCLRQQLVRMSGLELAQMERDKQQHRAADLAHARQRKPWAASILSQLWHHAVNIVNDHTRTVLILAVFGFKILEWWYTSAEERLSANQLLPPPPPPKAPLPHPDGVPLPDDPAACPLCRCASNHGVRLSCGRL